MYHNHPALAPLPPTIPHPSPTECPTMPKTHLARRMLITRVLNTPDARAHLSNKELLDLCIEVMRDDLRRARR